MFKFSVIIPVYNGENYILRALESLKNQTYSNLEIIIVNDGSTDSTERVVNDFIKNNACLDVKYYAQQNAGPSTARNFGLSVATGDYVAFLDSDDVFTPRLFEEISAVKEDFDACFFGFDEVDENGEYISKYSDKFAYLESAKSGTDVAKLKFSSKIWICNCNAVYKTKVLKENGINYPLGCYSGEDASFIYSALLASKKAVSINYVGSIIYTRKNSLMHSAFSEKYLTELTAIDELLFKVKQLKMLSDSEREYFYDLFTASKSYAVVAISKRIIRHYKKYRIFIKKLKEYGLKNACDYKKSKRFYSGKRKLELSLFKRFTYLFFVASRIFIWIKKD